MSKHEFHEMFFNPVNWKTTEIKVKSIAENIIKKFDNLSKLFSKPDEEFIKRLTKNVRDALSRFLNQQHVKETPKVQMMREMRK